MNLIEQEVPSFAVYNDVGKRIATIFWGGSEDLWTVITHNRKVRNLDFGEASKYAEGLK